MFLNFSSNRVGRSVKLNLKIVSTAAASEMDIGRERSICPIMLCDVTFLISIKTFLKTGVTKISKKNEERKCGACTKSMSGSGKPCPEKTNGCENLVCLACYGSSILCVDCAELKKSQHDHHKVLTHGNTDKQQKNKQAVVGLSASKPPIAANAKLIPQQSITNGKKRVGNALVEKPAKRQALAVDQHIASAPFAPDAQKLNEDSDSDLFEQPSADTELFNGFEVSNKDEDDDDDNNSVPSEDSETDPTPIDRNPFGPEDQIFPTKKAGKNNNKKTVLPSAPTSSALGKDPRQHAPPASKGSGSGKSDGLQDAGVSRKSGPSQQLMDPLSSGRPPAGRPRIANDGGINSKMSAPINKPAGTANSSQSDVQWNKGGTTYAGSRPPVKGGEGGSRSVRTSTPSSALTDNSDSASTVDRQLVGEKTHSPAFKLVGDCTEKALVIDHWQLTHGKNTGKLLHTNGVHEAVDMDALAIEEKKVELFNTNCNYWGSMIETGPRFKGIHVMYVKICHEEVARALGLPNPSKPFTVLVNVTKHLTIMIYTMRHMVQYTVNDLSASSQSAITMELFAILQHNHVVTDNIPAHRKKQISFDLMQSMLTPAIVKEFLRVNADNKAAGHSVMLAVFNKISGQQRRMLDTLNDSINTLTDTHKTASYLHKLSDVMRMCQTDGGLDGFTEDKAKTLRTDMIDNYDAYSADDWPFVIALEVVVLRLGMTNSEIVHRVMQSGEQLLNTVSAHAEALAIAIVLRLVTESKDDSSKRKDLAKSALRQLPSVLSQRLHVKKLLQESGEHTDNGGSGDGLVPVSWLTKMQELRGAAMTWLKATVSHDAGGDEDEELDLADLYQQALESGCS